MAKRFTEQFKHEAVQLVGKGRSLREVAQSLGIGISTLDRWVQIARRKGVSVAPMSAEHKRIGELEKEVAHLREVNEIIKKAHVYFVNHPSR